MTVLPCANITDRVDKVIRHLLLIRTGSKHLIYGVTTGSVKPERCEYYL
jgi:hypothetical protein